MAEISRTHADEGGPRTESLDRAFRRASEAPLRSGNRLTLLRNGPETLDEWLERIEAAERWVHLELFQFEGTGVGERFGEALSRKAREGVRVRVLYDWLGSFYVSRSFWRELRRAGVEVRVVNPPTPASPLRVVQRDHRKLLAVDGLYASTGGVSVADLWLERAPETGLPYRDTSVGVRGPAVADLERAFAGVWNLCGERLPEEELPDARDIAAAGDQDVRIIVQEPGKVRLLRTLEHLTSIVQKRMWIADAYFLSMATLTRGIIAAAQDGVDVRILVPTPATNDQPPIGTLSRAGYRQLLEAGVRIFEYGGPMMHAKTTVADGRFCRIGSTNLNFAGLVTNWELDLFAEDRTFGDRMERMFKDDLEDAREVILEPRGPGRNPRPRPESPATRAEQRVQRRPREAAPRALATATRLGRSAFEMTTREGLRRHERSVVAAASGAAFVAGLAGARFPKALAWPLSAFLGLLGLTGLLHAVRPPNEDEPSDRPERA
ncbi:Phosphatidylserine/phosphatidylglycerophosphate/cardiolipin synthase-related enzyme [Rubrobacter radiotolerans]|uniref:Phosphatidylserine/phosphatidylglycerophosphate/ cardiolipin synthase-related enzyme n=1 Tax=Rubrobacter radiotolerans TaxID=42256 RepID=A0A023X2F5_RUBRA|nr:phospholipase D-like domain-containing protein [Rubrobacter radiotolerans]AHY46244.1 Phosphatidylserine/phosphatidylglycerophosphate/cardiolipin synthase-related enzyme [Rubrobacter radiotolerans]MDX5893652.1 phospholipase D-like domain-containing protein [Rubrobacter radiotolerans]SMC04201.1 Phosphatidylserine/phosphatidylglycerophosphate/cardiolipin synthase [Rubrobacter radiotolerans DSM 5868]